MIHAEFALRLPVAVLFLLLVACQAGDPRGTSRRRGPSTEQAGALAQLRSAAGTPGRAALHARSPDPARPAERPSAEVGGPAAGAEVHAPEPGDEAPSGAVRWLTWEQGLAEAKRTHKPIMVVVYADWCPKCRALAPVLEQPPISTLAERFVMVRQNHDDEPAWLEPYNQKYGGYVPRIFFFDPLGVVKEDVTSGHPRYPYFYAATSVDLLEKSMRRALGS